MKGGPPGAPDTPTSVEASPRSLKRNMKQNPAKPRRNKQPAKPITPTGPMPTGMHPQVQVNAYKNSVVVDIGTLSKVIINVYVRRYVP